MGDNPDIPYFSERLIPARADGGRFAFRWRFLPGRLPVTCGRLEVSRNRPGRLSGQFRLLQGLNRRL